MLPLIVLLGATASGKTALSLALAQHLDAEILSCDSVAVFRHMEVGTAKPTPHERTLVPHHLLDLYDPDQLSTAGDYARHARAVLGELATRNTLPILSGGTGLYLRALLDGLSPSPPATPTLRLLLRRRAELRSPAHLHRTLARLDLRAAERIHPNDLPKVIRAIEVSVALRVPITEQWQQQGRDALTGYAVLRLGLDPPRPALYERINRRAASMFANGLVEEMGELIARFGPACRPFTSLGYAEAAAVLRKELTPAAAIAAAQQGHRNYSKRQRTWFRREAKLHPVHWLRDFGDSPAVIEDALALVSAHLKDLPSENVATEAAPPDRSPVEN